MKSELKIITVPNLKCQNATEVITILANRLIDEKIVAPEYLDAILKREQEYPTGLPSNEPRVAIPHADHDLVNQTSLVVATLENPVKFHNMENTAEELDVEIVIMMAISEAHGQIEMLQKIVAFIQDAELKAKVLACKNEIELLNTIQPILDKKDDL